MEGIGMLTRAWLDSRDEDSTTTPGAGATTTSTTRSDQPAQVVDLQDWRIRRIGRRRGFTPGLCEYVPRHRAEAALGN
jgi:hypothetical protein